MSTLKFFNKKFLIGFLFLLVIFLSGSVKADTDINAPGFTNTNTINNYSGGSFYSQQSNTSAGIGTSQTQYFPTENKGDGKASLSLYSTEETVNTVTDAQVEALKMKLKDSGSTFDITKLNANNVQVISVKGVSTYKYDPTPADRGNGDGLILTAATANGHLYTPKNALPENSGKADATETDSSTANGFLNTVDVAEKNPVGTTIGAKDQFVQNREAQALEQQKLDATQAAQTAFDNNKDPNQTQALSDALTQARTGSANSASNLATLKGQQASMTASRNATIPKPGECNKIWNFFDNNCILIGISRVTNIGFKFVAFIAYLAGMFFDYSLELSMNSAQFFKQLGVVEVTWSFIRDILNMSFIFILLWTAIQILINGEGKYNAKQTLIRVIVVAILINFSLFGAKLMVDGSNIVSLKIYEAMKATDATGQNSSISTRVMQTIGMSTLFDLGAIYDTKSSLGNGSLAACQNDPSKIITIDIFGSIFLLVLILALALAGVLFLLRMINIIVLFIKSPLWVWGYVLPSSGTITKFKDNWEKEMKHVIVFPVVYMFWMLIAIIIFGKLGTIQQVSGTVGGQTQSISLLQIMCGGSTNAGFGDSISLIAIFCIVIAFMMMAIKYGLSSADGGGVTGKLSGSVASKFGKYQDAVTTGLVKRTYEKAKDLGGKSVGDTRRALTFAKDKTIGGAKRTGGAFLGGAAGMLAGDGAWKGTKEGFLNPGIYGKEKLAQLNANIAEILPNSMGGAAFAKMSNTQRTSAATIRKDVEAKRVEGAKNNEQARQEAATVKYTPMTQKQWEKKYGAIGVNQDKADEYKKYVKDNIEKYGDVALQKGILKNLNADGIEHLDAIAKKAIKQEIVDGKIVVTVDNYETEAGFDDVINQHKEGGKLATNSEKTISNKTWKPWRSKRSDAEVKVKQSVRRQNKNTTAVEANKIKEEKVAREKLNNIPEDSDLDRSILGALGGPITAGNAEKVKEVKELNSAIKQRENAIAAQMAESDPGKRAQWEEKILKLNTQLEDKVEYIKDMRTKIRVALDKREEAKKEEVKK